MKFGYVERGLWYVPCTGPRCPQGTLVSLPYSGPILCGSHARAYHGASLTYYRTRVTPAGRPNPHQVRLEPEPVSPPQRYGIIIDSRRVPAPNVELSRNAAALVRLAEQYDRGPVVTHSMAVDLKTDKPIYTSIIRFTRVRAALIIPHATYTQAGFAGAWWPFTPAAVPARVGADDLWALVSGLPLPERPETKKRTCDRCGRLNVRVKISGDLSRHNGSDGETCQ